MNEQEQKSQENQGFLNKKIEEILFSVVENRAKEYTEKKREVVDSSSISGLISNAANKNAAISGGIGLIPGPWGMAAAIPEISMIIKSQLNLIYDISKANGKTKKELTPGLVLGIFASSMGVKTIEVLAVHGGKLLAKESSIIALKKVIKIISVRIAAKLTQSSVAKWIPVAGAVAMATWSRYSTKKIGEKAHKLTLMEVVYDESSFEDVVLVEDKKVSEISSLFMKKDLENKKDSILISSLTSEKPLEVKKEPNKLNLTKELKIKSLINLMKIDKKLEDSEVEFCHNIIADSGLESSIQNKLIQELSSVELIDIDFSGFDKKETISLLLDMIALSKIDGEFHVVEKIYIKQVASELDMDREDVKELLAS